MRKKNHLQSLILESLKASGKSKYWLANAVARDEDSGVSKSAVYQYLSGKHDTTGRVIWSCMRHLGMTVCGGS